MNSSGSCAENGGLWQTLVERHAGVVLKATPLAGSVSDLMQQAWERYYEIEASGIKSGRVLRI